MSPDNNDTPDDELEDEEKDVEEEEDEQQDTEGTEDEEEIELPQSEEDAATLRTGIPPFNLGIDLSSMMRNMNTLQDLQNPLPPEARKTLLKHQEKTLEEIQKVTTIPAFIDLIQQPTIDPQVLEELQEPILDPEQFKDLTELPEIRLC